MRRCPRQPSRSASPAGVVRFPRNNHSVPQRVTVGFQRFQSSFVPSPCVPQPTALCCSCSIPGHRAAAGIRVEAGSSVAQSLRTTGSNWHREKWLSFESLSPRDHQRGRPAPSMADRRPDTHQNRSCPAERQALRWQRRGQGTTFPSHLSTGPTPKRNRPLQYPDFNSPETPASLWLNAPVWETFSAL